MNLTGIKPVPGSLHKHCGDKPPFSTMILTMQQGTNGFLEERKGWGELWGHALPAHSKNQPSPPNCFLSGRKDDLMGQAPEAQSQMWKPLLSPGLGQEWGLLLNGQIPGHHEQESNSWIWAAGGMSCRAPAGLWWRWRWQVRKNNWVVLSAELWLSVPHLQSLKLELPASLLSSPSLTSSIFSSSTYLLNQKQ